MRFLRARTRTGAAPRVAALTMDPASSSTPTTLDPDELRPQHDPSKNLWRAPPGQKLARALL